MNDKDQKHLDAVIRLYEKKLKESVTVEWLEEILKEVENKKTSKIVLENGYELESKNLSFEKQEGIHMTIDFIRKRLKAVEEKE